ncbi:MAG: DUF3859 domain-containing protein [Desulfovibrionaceae bacterium]
MRTCRPATLFAACTLLLALASVARAEPGVYVLDEGVYAFPEEQAGEACPPGDRNCVAGERLMRATTDVEAAIGRNFGYRYRVEGVPKGSSVPLAFTLTRPPVVAPETGEVIRGDSFEQTVPAGQPHYDGYVFESEWELVSGEYVFEIRHLGRLLSRRVFRVRAHGP